MSASEAPPRGCIPGRRRATETAEEQIRRRGLRPIASVEDMARDDVFDTDQELDEFLAHVYTERHANLT